MARTPRDIIQASEERQHRDHVGFPSSILTNPLNTLGVASSKSLGRLDHSALVLTRRHQKNTDFKVHAVLQRKGMPLGDVLHNLQPFQKPSEMLMLSLMPCGVLLVNDTFIEQVSDQPPLWVDSNAV